VQSYAWVIVVGIVVVAAIIYAGVFLRLFGGR